MVGIESVSPLSMYFAGSVSLYIYYIILTYLKRVVFCLWNRLYRNIASRHKQTNIIVTETCVCIKYRCGPQLYLLCPMPFIHRLWIKGTGHNYIILT